MTKEPPHISGETRTEVLPSFRREKYRKDKAARAHTQSESVRAAHQAGREARLALAEAGKR